MSRLQLQVLSDMVPPDAHHALLGQYERYVDHVRADIARWGSEEAIAAHDKSKPTRTPTFAAAELLIENERSVQLLVQQIARIGLMGPTARSGD